MFKVWSVVLLKLNVIFDNLFLCRLWLWLWLFAYLLLIIIGKPSLDLLLHFCFHQLFLQKLFIFGLIFRINFNDSFFQFWSFLIKFGVFIILINGRDQINMRVFFIDQFLNYFINSSQIHISAENSEVEDIYRSVSGIFIDFEITHFKKWFRFSNQIIFQFFFILDIFAFRKIVKISTQFFEFIKFKINGLLNGIGVFLGLFN